MNELLLRVPDWLPDSSPWHRGTCPMCGSEVMQRTHNLRAVAATGDESYADVERRPAADSARADRAMVMEAALIAMGLAREVVREYAATMPPTDCRERIEQCSQAIDEAIEAFAAPVVAACDEGGAQ